MPLTSSYLAKFFFKCSQKWPYLRLAGQTLLKCQSLGPRNQKLREIGSAFLQALNSYRNQVQCTLLGACTLGEGAQGAGRETLFPFVILK